MTPRHRAPRARLAARLAAGVPAPTLAAHARRAFVLAAVLATVAALVGCQPASAAYPPPPPRIKLTPEPTPVTVKPSKLIGECS